MDTWLITMVLLSPLTWGCKSSHLGLWDPFQMTGRLIHGLNGFKWGGDPNYFGTMTDGKKATKFPWDPWDERYMYPHDEWLIFVVNVDRYATHGSYWDLKATPTKQKERQKGRCFFHLNDNCELLIFEQLFSKFKNRKEISIPYCFMGPDPQKGEIELL